MPHTSARFKADQGESNTHITQDVVRAIRVLLGCFCALSFAIEAMSKTISMYERTHFMDILAVLTSNLITSFVGGLTVVSYCRHNTYTPYIAIIASL